MGAWRELTMFENKTSRVLPDIKRIDIHDRYEVRYWTQSLGVSEDELTCAVNQVGTSPEKVREYLKKK